MMAIAAHFRYISKNGRLDIEDERGETLHGKETLYELAEDWRLGGTLIADIAEPAQRRERARAASGRAARCTSQHPEPSAASECTRALAGQVG
jgi:hypothetical protein